MLATHSLILFLDLFLYHGRLGFFTDDFGGFFGHLGFLLLVCIILKLHHELKCLESGWSSCKSVGTESRHLRQCRLSSIGIGFRRTARLVLWQVDIDSFDSLVRSQDQFFRHLTILNYLINFLVNILIDFLLKLRYDLLLIDGQRV